MKEVSVAVEGEDEDDARARGARELGVQPAEVVVRRLKGSLFEVRLKSAPDDLQIRVSEDKMSVTMACVAPPPHDRAPITVERVESSLRALSVTFGIDRAAIARAVKCTSSKGESPQNVRIAVGTPPVDGRDATIELRVGPGAVNRDLAAQFSVKPGQVLAVKTPAARGIPGRNVLGERVPASDGRDRRFVPGNNVTASPDGTVFTSNAYGLAEVTATSVSVRKAVQISTDARYAEMAVFPFLADGNPLLPDDVLAALAGAGVVHGIREEAIAAALASNQPAHGIRAAEGTPARDGIDGRIEFRFRLNGMHPEAACAERREKRLAETEIVKELVADGDILAILTPSTPAEDGRDVTGRTVTARRPVRRELRAGANVVLLDDGKTFVVTTGATGYANLVDGIVSVEDPLVVSDDRLSAQIVVHPPCPSARRLTPDLVARMFEAHGIVQAVDTAAIEDALVRAANQVRPVPGVTVARGIPPEHGEDARLRLAFRPRKAGGTIIEGTDRMDYRERGAIQNVRAGGLLAEKTPATAGSDGVDVFGKPIPARPGKDQSFKTAGNVTVSEDGLRYLAGIDGAATLIGDDTLGVFREYEVPGDVDYATGNLVMDGTVRIRGWIRSGFVVRASGDVIVGKGIEDAVVEAGGNIEVDGGIIGTNSGSVRARGHVMARFTQYARIEAGGGVFVQDSVVRSRIAAAGRVEVSGTRGCVIGGLLAASRTAEAGGLGAESGVATLIDVGTDANTRAAMAKYESELAAPRRLEKKVRLAASLLAQKNRTGTISAAEAQYVVKLAKFRRQAAVIESRLEKLRQAAGRACAEHEDGPATVKVRKAVHEGTAVTIAGYRYRVRDEIAHGGEFVLDTENWSVEYRDREEQGDQ